MSFDDDVQQNPWTRPGFIAAALVVAIVVVLGIFLATRGNGNDVEPTPVATAGTSQPTVSTSHEPEPTEPAEAAGGPSVCGLDDVELEGTLTQAPESEWTLHNTTAVPSSAAGPGVVEESGLRYCYARTPEGALLAAANALALGDDPSIRDEFIDHLVADGPGRDAFREKSREPGTTVAVRIQTAGFRLLEYDGTNATVDLAMTTSSGAEGATAIALVWENGDWRLRLRDDGSLLNLPVQLPDLTGYIPWAGV